MWTKSQQLIVMTRALPFAKMMMLFALINFAHAQTITAIVEDVLDGDTIIIQTIPPSIIPMKVRLAGIDAPESNQSFGIKSQINLGDIIFKKKVSISFDKVDGFGRLIGLITIPPGLNISLEQIKSGYAWAYRTKDPELINAETIARSQKLGLWSDPNPIPPWIFRK